jgi:hypothetical protein
MLFEMGEDAADLLTGDESIPNLLSLLVWF